MNTYTISTQSMRGSILCAPPNLAASARRPNLNGVQLLAQGAQVLLRATDGNVAFEDMQPTQVVAPINIIIPLDAAKMISKAKSHTVILQPADGGRYECAGILFTPVGGVFPDVSRIIPARIGNGWPSDRVDYDWELVARCQAAMRIATGSKGGVYRIYHTDNMGGLMYRETEQFPRCVVAPMRQSAKHWEN